MIRKISARDSGAGNGCANFMGAWGGGLGFLGRRAANFVFMDAGIFSILEYPLGTKTLPNSQPI